MRAFQKCTTQESCEALSIKYCMMWIRRNGEIFCKLGVL